MAPETYTYLHC